MALQVAKGERDVKPTSRWQVVELHSVLERIAGDEADPSADRCRLVVRFREESGHGDPRFELVQRGRTLGDFEVEPARRPGWLLLTPLAFATDIALAVPIVLGSAVLFVLPGLDDFSWSPWHEHNWHRRRSDERRAKEASSS